VIVRDDRDAGRASAVVVPAEAGPGTDRVRRDGVGVVTLAIEARRLDRFGGAPPFSGKGSMRIALQGEDDALRTAQAVLDPAVAATAFAPGGGLRLAPIPAGGVLAARSLDAGACDLVRLATGSAAALLAAAPAQAEANLWASTTLTEIAAHRERTEVLVEAAASARLPSAHGAAGFMAHAFVGATDGVEHLALVKGAPEPGALVRVHSECLTGDAFGSLRCDCGEQLRAALASIGAASSGALVYLRGHEGRGIGLANKIRAYALQDLGLDTAEANAALGFAHDSREYAVAAQILKRLGLRDIRLLSNNPRKACALRAFGVTVREELPLVMAANPHNLAYLDAKRDKLGHRLPHGDGAFRIVAGRG
jgi:3,4-dihydroxy 2-butanone 4-phosphate synthase/GTP cyclohydrolase II